MTGSAYVMTAHADERIRQRGVRTDTMEFVLANFDSDHCQPDGRSTIWISTSGLKRLSRDGHPASLVEKAAKLCLVVSPSGHVVTVLNGPISRSHRGR